MIVGKVYDVNLKNVDEIITEIAKEIGNGYTVSYIEHEPHEPYTCSINPYKEVTAHIHLKRKDSMMYEN